MKSVYLIKPYVIENRLLIIIGLISLIAVDMLQLYIPRVIKWAIDDLTAYQIDLTGLLIYSLYIIGIAILMLICRYGWRFCLIGMSRRVEEGLRNRLFEHIQKLSASYFNKTHTGDLMAHATSDIQHIRMATGMGLVALTDGIFLGTAAIGFMAYISIRLTLLVLIPMPFIIFGTRFFSKKMHRKYQEVQVAFSDLTETVRERFSGIRIIKAYNREDESLSKIEAISGTCVQKNLERVKVTGAFFPMMLFFSNLSLAIVLYIGGRETILTTITPGDFVAFISYLGLLTWPMMAVGWVTNLVQRGKASLDRINAVLQTKPEIADIAGLQSRRNAKSCVSAGIKRGEADTQNAATLHGGIIFEKVTFSYPPDSLPVLCEININLEHGKTLGIVGPPGAGKTTLLNLIPRLYDVSNGRILIGDKDIRHIPLHELRSEIAFVPQEPFLFAGTIRDNITFGDDKVSEAELIEAVKAASLYDTICSFPNGFESVAGERGVILSGGQKQRIALARALLRKSSVLILDDPISQVDMETGNTIINTIRSLIGKRTVLTVSHRISAVRFADQIIALKEGFIAESGTHDQLMKNNRYYAKTFYLQELEEEFN